MLLPFDFQPDARQDVRDILAYFDSLSDTAGDRFYAALKKTVDMLRRNPEMGEKYQFDSKREIRHRTVIGFENYVIFYRTEKVTLLIVRVLYGGRNFSTTIF